MKRTVRILGTILIVGGLALLGYAVYAYMQVQAVANLPANLPGATPATLPSLDGGPDAASAPTIVWPATETLEPPRAAAPIQATVTAPTAHTNPVITFMTPTPAPTVVVNAQTRPAVRLIVRGAKVKKDVPIKDATWVSVQQNGQWIADWSIPYDAAGHHVNTPNPGMIGNAIFSGHHNLIGPNEFGVGLFAYNWNLGAGDQLFFQDAGGATYKYLVRQSFPLLEEGQPLKVREEHAAQVMAQGTDAMVTLITCWAGPQNPFENNTYRWIVQAKLVGPVNPESIPTKE